MKILQFELFRNKKKLTVFFVFKEIDNVFLHSTAFQTNYEFDFLASVDPFYVLTFPYLKTDQSSSHNISSLYARV